MKVTVPHIFRTGETLDPDRLNENFEKMATNLHDVATRRYTHSVMRRQFESSTNASAAYFRQFHFTPPWGVEVVAFEIHVWGTADTVVTVTADSGVTGWVDQKVTAAGATTRASQEGAAAAAASCYIDAAATAKFSWSAPGTWTINRMDFILHVRTDQHAAGLPEFTPPGLNSGDADDAATLNTAFTSWATQYGLENTRTERRRIEVLQGALTNGASLLHSQDLVHLIPQTGSTLARVQLWAGTDTSRALDCDIYDELTANQGTATATGDGTDLGSGEVTLNDSQEDDPLNASSKDWTMEFGAAAGSGSVDDAYVVLFFE